MPPVRKPMILVVDDEPSVSKTLSWLLEEAGYSTVYCLDAKTALGIVTGVAADAAIVDVMLPDGDGIETALEIQKRLPTCRILLITGENEGFGRILRAQERGLPFEVAPKPVEVPKLLHTLAQFTQPKAA